MAAELADLGHAWVSPETKLILREAMTAENLLLVGIPLERTDLQEKVLCYL